MKFIIFSILTVFFKGHLKRMVRKARLAIRQSYCYKTSNIILQPYYTNSWHWKSRDTSPPLDSGEDIPHVLGCACYVPGITMNDV